MVVTSLWYEFGQDASASASTIDYTYPTPASGDSTWDVTIRWERYIEICNEIIRKAEDKLRMEIHRKSLFIKKVLPKLITYRVMPRQMLIPSTRNFRCSESRRR